MPRGRFILVAGLPIAAIAVIAACVGDDPPSSIAATNDGSTDDRTSPPPPPPPPAPPGDDGGSDAPADHHVPTFCDGKSKPVGVSDFFCADWDEGSVNPGFTNLFQTDGGVLKLVDVFKSSPQSVLAASPTSADAAAFPRGSALEWTMAGATNVQSVTITVEMNPTSVGGVFAPGTGYTELVGFDFEGSGHISVRYTNGGNIAQTGGTNYVGYFLHSDYMGMVQADYKITPALTADTWTTVQLLVSFATSKATVKQNGIDVVGVQNVSVPTGSTTSITARVGDKATGALSRPTGHRYDNLQVEIVRN